MRSDETSGAVRARIEIERDWRLGTSKVPTLRRTRRATLVVAGAPEVRLPLSRCAGDDPEVQADADGSRIGYRCDEGRWSLVYRRARHAFEHCSIDAGSSDTIDWRSMPSWDAAAPDLLVCAHQATRLLPPRGRDVLERGPPGIFAAERAAASDAALARLLVRTRALPMMLARCGCDAWIEAARGLPVSARAPVVESLREASREAVSVQVWRALVLRGVEGSDERLRATAERLVPGVGDAHATASGSGPGRAARHDITTDEQAYAHAALAVLLRHLATRLGRPAGELACSALTRIAEQRSRVFLFGATESRGHLTLVVGATHAPCAALPTSAGCGAFLECEPATGAAAHAQSRTSIPCRADQLEAELRAAIAVDPLRAVWVQAEAGRAHDVPVQPHAGRIEHAAAVLGATLSREAALKMARRHYRLEPAHGPECSALPASDRGRPCRCAAFSLRETACSVGAEVSTVDRDRFCTLTFDDRSAVARQSRADCIRFGACDRDDQCCSGQRCAAYVDGGTGYCRSAQPDAPDAAADAI